MRRITETELAALKERIAVALAGIPKAHNRERERVAGDIWRVMLQDLPDDGTTVEDNIGARAIYWKRGNLGTRRWPDYYTSVCWHTFIFDGDRRSNLCLVVPDEVDGMQPSFLRKASMAWDYGDPIHIVSEFLDHSSMVEGTSVDYYLPAILNRMCDVDSCQNLVFRREAYRPSCYMPAIEDSRITSVEFELGARTDGEAFKQLFVGEGDAMCEVFIDYLEAQDVEPPLIYDENDVIEFIDGAGRTEFRLQVNLTTADGNTYVDRFGTWTDDGE